MSTGFDDTLRWAHRTNIERYHRILQTALTDDERRFVRRRIGEEQRAIAELDGAGTAKPRVSASK